LSDVFIRSKQSIALGQLWKHSTEQKTGVDTFGYYSAESEWIWMKSAAVENWPWQILGMIRAGKTVSEAANILFLVCKENNAQFRAISRGINFTTFEHNTVGRCSGKNFQNRILKILP